MKSLRNDRPPPTVPNALSIVVVDACPADYMATLAASRLGVRWQFLGCGRMALRMASVQAVDLWVVNVSLPDMSGLELCRMSRERGPVHVFLIADRYSENDERAARVFGAALFACKPVQAEWFDRNYLGKPLEGCVLYKGCPIEPAHANH